MKIHFITGATGFVGKYLVEALLNEGEHVWTLIRPLNGMTGQERSRGMFSDFEKKWPDTFRVIEGDILLEGLGVTNSYVEEMLRNETVLWHLAANLSFSEEKAADVYSNNYQGTVNVCDFANKTAKKLIHVSTAYVSGNAKSLGEGELDKGQKFRNMYEKSKFEAEKHVLNNCEILYIIFRPTVIIGDAYRGKAEGCTFGYYRYLFIFHFFKKQLIKSLKKNNLGTLILKGLGTKYDQKDATLKIPWLILPYPINGQVDMITVDFVIESMLSIYKKGLFNRTVHLTCTKPPKFNFLLNAVLQDLGYQKFKMFPVPAFVYKLIINDFYFFAVGLRKYIKSVMWYVPYFTHQCKFERTTAEKYLKEPHEISRELVFKINSYAKEEILDHIEV